MKTSTAILLTLVVGAAAGGLAWGLSGSKGTTFPGYVVESDCGGITLTDETSARIYATSRGKAAAAWVLESNIAWLKEMQAVLGLPPCPVATFPKGSLRPWYLLTRWFLGGAAAAGRIGMEYAAALAAGLRNDLIAIGADPLSLPEGL